MKQTTFADSSFEIATKKTRKQISLEEMNAMVPWASLIGIIQGYAPWAESGRPPFPAETMLRIYLLQHFFEEFGLTKIILAKFNAILQSKGLVLRSGRAIFARLMAAPSSPKIDGGMRNPAMHQTKKGNQYHFRIEAHIGVDAEFRLVHTLVTTAANVHALPKTRICFTARRTTYSQIRAIAVEKSAKRQMVFK